MRIVTKIIILVVVALVVSFMGTASAAKCGDHPEDQEPVRKGWEGSSEPPGYLDCDCHDPSCPENHYGWPEESAP